MEVTYIRVWKPCWQDKQHSSSHAQLCLQVSEGYHLTGNYSNPNEREYKRHEKSFCGLGGKELANRSDPLDLKVRSLANSVSLLLHDEPVNMTPRLRAELQTAKSLWPILRTPGRSGWDEEQRFSFIFVQLKLAMDGPLLYVTNTGLHVKNKTKNNNKLLLERGIELYNSVPSAKHKYGIRQCRSMELNSCNTILPLFSHLIPVILYCRCSHI